MRRPWAALVAASSVFVLLLVACDQDGSDRTPSGGPGADAGAARSRALPIRATPAQCAVGKRPGYFVPGGEEGPALLLGCARLGVSGRRIEFSGDLENIDGQRAFCMNPAFAGRGERGFYIPAVCAFGPLHRFAIQDAQHPREGVRDYALVVWGTAAPSAAEVVIRYGREAARAAVFKVGGVLARRLGQPPFSFFVVELPLRAACVPISVREQRSGETRRVGPKPTVCRRVRSQRRSRSVASVRRMLEDEGATRRQAQEIVRLLSLRLSAQQMHIWLSDPDKSHPVPDPSTGKEFEDAGLEDPDPLNWTPVNAVSAGKTQLVIDEARRYVAR